MIEHLIARILGYVGRSQLRAITSQYTKLEKDAQTAAANIRSHIDGNRTKMRALSLKKLALAAENDELHKEASQAEKLAERFASFAN